MKRELIVFVLFLVVNVALSVNCVFFTLAEIRAKKTEKENFYKDNPFSVQMQRQDYLFIENIDIDSINPLVVRFKMKYDEQDVCLKIDEAISQYEIKSLFKCNKMNNLNENNSKWVIQEGKESLFDTFSEYDDFLISNQNQNVLYFLKNNRTILEMYTINETKRTIKLIGQYNWYEKKFRAITGQVKLNRANYNSLLRIEAPSSLSPDVVHFLFFEQKERKDFKSFKLEWDKGKDKIEMHANEIFWRFLQFIGLIIDILTFPIQFIVGIFLFIVKLFIPS